MQDVRQRRRGLHVGLHLFIPLVALAKVGQRASLLNFRSSFHKKENQIMNQTLSVSPNCSVHLPKLVAVSYFFLIPVEASQLLRPQASVRSLCFKGSQKGDNCLSCSLLALSLFR